MNEINRPRSSETNSSTKSSSPDVHHALPYYNYNNLLSRNGTFNFVVGGRGLGKTYGAKQWAINDWLKSGNEFIYLRRYKSELVSKSTFFADIIGQYPGLETRINGNVAEARLDGEEKWRTMGYFVALSTALTQKSIAYPNVTKIIYDEFIIQKGAIHYLPDETVAFQEFYSTVDRWKDKTRVLFLANAISIYNPYFISWGIEPNGKEWYSKRDNFIVCHFPDGATFASAVYKTRFGAFIKDSEYADYAVGSEFKDANSLLIKGKNESATYFCRIETSMEFNVWVDYTGQGPVYYLNSKHPNINDTLFTTNPSHLGALNIMIDKSAPIIRGLAVAYKRAQMYFSTPAIRAAFEELIK